MLFDNLQQDLKQAMLSREEVKVATLRLLISEVKNSQIAKGHDLSEDEILVVVAKEAKKRKEAADGFRQGSREESAAQEEAELAVLMEYLPSQIGDEELTNIVETTITELGATSMIDMSKVIGAVLAKVKGQADGGRVSGIAKRMLSKTI